MQGKGTPHSVFSYSFITLTSIIALLLPVSDSVGWFSLSMSHIGPLFVLISLAFVWRFKIVRQQVLIQTAVILFMMWLAITIVGEPEVMGNAATGYWLFVISIVALIWLNLSEFSSVVVHRAATKRFQFLLIPCLFGACFIFLWQVVANGFGIPGVLLPAPSMIGSAFVASTDTLVADFIQTVVRAVIPGYIIGNACGFMIALLADRVPFLQRGLLPIGNLVSAIPIVGIAPIMVMWFGFDWQSKAAVVVIMTFFPMLVNTMVGLSESGKIEKDLMRSYAASYGRQLRSLRLPTALPFIFNALKINSTLALIGAIVAEFFGTPIVGMGFRISTEVGRMNIDMVWATILVAAITGSVFYGLFALMERWFTFWHPSFRK